MATKLIDAIDWGREQLLSTRTSKTDLAIEATIK